MRHDEVGRGLTRGVEQADGVATDEVERPHRLIIGGDTRGRRTGEVISLRILVHGWPHCPEPRSLVALGPRWEVILAK